MQALMPTTPVREVPWDQIVPESVQEAKQKVGKYGPQARRCLDFIFYYNRRDCIEMAAETPELDLEEIKCRSLSIVSNFFAMVVIAAREAPEFLRNTAGVRRCGLVE